MIRVSCEPLVTIGVPFLNPGQWFVDAIKSIFAQTHTNWELIMVDDGSTDGSLELARQISDPRVKVISDGRNAGLVYRLNQIIDIANGDYIARMDADDLMHPNRLERQVNVFRDNPQIDVVDTGAYILSRDGVPVGIRRRRTDSQQGPDPVRALKHGIVLHPAVMARRDWYRVNKYDPAYPRAEDRELFVRTFRDTGFYQIPDPLYFYRYVGNVRIRAFLESYRSERKVLRRYGPKLIGRLRTAGLYFRSVAKSIAVPLLVGIGRQDIVTRSAYHSITHEQHISANEIIAYIRKQRVAGWDSIGE